MTRKTRTFSDINLLFTSHPATGDVVKRLDDDAIKNSIKNLVRTRNFERPFNPDLGCQVYSLLFENFTPATSELVKRSIMNVLGTYEPRCKLNDVRVAQTDDMNQMAITIEYQIINSDRPQTVTTFLSRVR